MSAGPRLRQDLVATPVEADGVAWVDVADPRGGEAFRFYDFEYAIAQQMDGRSLDEVAAWARDAFGFEATGEGLMEFAGRLRELGFLAEEEAAPAEEAAPEPVAREESEGVEAAEREFKPIETAPSAPLSPTLLAEGALFGKEPVSMPLASAPPSAPVPARKAEASELLELSSADMLPEAPPPLSTSTSRADLSLPAIPAEALAMEIEEPEEVTAPRTPFEVGPSAVSVSTDLPTLPPTAAPVAPPPEPGAAAPAAALAAEEPSAGGPSVALAAEEPSAGGPLVALEVEEPSPEELEPVPTLEIKVPEAVAGAPLARPSRAAFGELPAAAFDAAFEAEEPALAARAAAESAQAERAGEPEPPAIEIQNEIPTLNTRAPVEAAAVVDVTPAIEVVPAVEVDRVVAEDVTPIGSTPNLLPPGAPAALASEPPSIEMEIAAGVPEPPAAVPVPAILEEPPPRPERRQPPAPDVVVMPPVLDDTTARVGLPGAVGARQGAKKRTLEPMVASSTPAGAGRRVALTVTALAIFAAAVGGIWKVMSAKHGPEPIGVTVVSPRPETVYRFFDKPGVVRPGGSKTLSFDAGGKVAELPAIGASFRAGEILAKLDGAKHIETEMGHNRERLAYYQQMLETMRAAGNKGEVRQAEIKIAEKNRLLAEGEAALGKLAIVATDAGSVAELLVAVGAQVAPGAAALRIKGGELRGEFDLPPADGAAASRLDFCRVESEGPAAGRSLDCTFAPPEGSRVLVDLPVGRGFAAGQALRLARSRFESVFRVPVSAVVRVADTDRLFVVGGGRAEARAITVAERTPSEALVSQGVDVGDSVIVDVPPGLIAGAPVSIQGTRP